MSYQLLKENPIAVFDSGMGGISVLRELLKVMPNEDYIFFGDSKNAPYGIKTKEQVNELTCQHADEFFKRGCKALVVACNTATTAAVRNLRNKYPDIPIVGIEPAVKPAALSKEHPTVLVMATPMTIREEKLHNLISRFNDQADIIPLPCPGLMDFVERGDTDSKELEEYLISLLKDYRINKLDAVVLGCTHYPFVKKKIKEVIGDDVLIFDGGYGTAKEARRRLEVAGLRNPRTTKGTVIFENSLGQEKIEQEKALCYMDE
ncbi:glutamate racemase [Lachnobacterium bovis]|uniref:Glutamate racemase n=1 Tax=Lachnobacterium bovis TaxID=140626 RepID=A0A1H9P3L4_9FIRM|nr:glutamate racemase [Lachnobacterium bovis]SER42657.1 glutamate racemase [Lachnobacterium bovis]